MKWWCALNTSLIILLAVFVEISLDVPDQIEEKVMRIEQEWDGYKSHNQDTIVVNINNNVQVPKTIKLIQ